MGVEFCLGTHPTQFAPVPEHTRTDVRPRRPGQSAIPEHNFPESFGLRQRAKHRSRQRRSQVECANPAVSKTQPQLRRTNHRALDDFWDWVHLNNSTSMAQSVARAADLATDAMLTRLLPNADGVLRLAGDGAGERNGNSDRLTQ